MTDRNGQAACEVRGLTFRYFQESKHNILEDADLSFEQGKVTVILGASGCGKSTLAGVICGLYPANGGFLEKGTVRVCQEDIQTLTPAKRCRIIAQMFQNPDLQFCMRNLEEELYFCLENLQVPPEEMAGRIEAFAEEYSVKALLKRPFHTLSGGEKQKAALCCLFLIGPKILVLDEPFANLDRAARENYLQLLEKARSLHPDLTVIAIDHRAENWIGHGDICYILGEKGTLRARIPMNELEDRHEILQEEGLVDPFRIVSRPEKKEAENAETVLSLTNVSLRHSKKQEPFFKNVNLHAKKGEIIACLGPSGTGKTSLFLTLLGQKPYDGQIHLFGKELNSYKKKDLFSQVGIVFQNPADQFVALTVLEEMTAGLSEERKQELDEKKQEELLSQFGLRPYRKYAPFMLSQGQQRRLAVLTMLVRGQKLLLLDEPTYGQDGRACEAMMMQMRELAGRGITIVFSTHDTALAEEYADRFWYMKGSDAFETDQPIC